MRGRPFKWEILDFYKTLPTILDASAELRSVYDRAVQRHLPTAQNPWSLIFTFDEYIPGNKLSVAEST